MAIVMEHAPVQSKKSRAKKPATPAPGQWTYEDYLSLPDDGKRYEVIEGVLYMGNAPNFEHQYVVGELFAEIRQLVKSKMMGQIVAAPFEIHLSEKTRPVQPDIVFIKKERWPGGNPKFFEGAPDLIIEVLSPSTINIDRHIKFEAYERAGVPEYWLVDPQTQKIEIYALKDGQYELQGEYVGDEEVISPTFDGLRITAKSVFPPR